jgi:hypothetical protein
MKIKFGDEIFILKNYPQYEDIRQTKDMFCQCSYSNYNHENFNMIGYCETQQGFMAVFECEKCGEKYRHHIGTTSRNTIKGFIDDAGLALFLQKTR